MKITLNGESREITDATTLGALLAQIGLAGKPVVIEQNHTALLPREIESAPLSEGDVIEIVQITAGG
ncbi:MAG: sulfur carrier protein ThiS [Verrucomicrobiales bacterium]|nr:sulfur carrier protein ThiS [Verrucomicrobiales bacterium]